MTNIIPRITDYLLVEAGTRPVSAIELAVHLKIDPALVTPPGEHETNPEYDADLVAYLEGCIDSAVASGEAYTKRTFTRSTWTAFLDDFVSGQQYEIRKCPFVSMDSIERYVSGVETALDIDTYYVTQSRSFPRVAPTHGNDWPSDADERMQSVVFSFTAGYGAGEDGDPEWAMPADLKRAITAHAAALYSNRGDCIPGTGITDVIPPCSSAVYQRYRIIDIHMGI